MHSQLLSLAGIRKKFTKSLSDHYEDKRISLMVNSSPRNSWPVSVSESMMGLVSPSQSTKGSFGPKKRTRSRCPNRTVFPGPGHYQLRIHIMNWGKVAGYTCIGITYFSFSVGMYFFVIRLALRWALSNFLLWYPVIDISARVFMGIWSHLACVLGDPGFVFPIKDRTPGSDVCKKCQADKPPRTHHCSTCNACVEGMDHHCPWINKCVGIKNRKAFLLFLAYTCSAAVECLILAVVRLATCPSVSDAIMVAVLRLAMGNEAVERLLAKASTADTGFRHAIAQPTCDLTLDYLVTGIVSIGISFMTVIFIGFIASDQIYSILNNQTHVEVLKGTKGPSRTIREALVDTFGMEPSLWWLVPIDWRFVPNRISVIAEKKLN